MYKLSTRSRGRIDGINPILIEIIEEAIKESPFDFGIPEHGGLRTDEEQIEMYAQGRTKPGRIVTWTLRVYTSQATRLTSMLMSMGRQAGTLSTLSLLQDTCKRLHVSVILC